MKLFPFEHDLCLGFIYFYRSSNTPVHGTTSRLSRSAAHSVVGDVPDIVEVDEDGDIENIESKPEIDIELVQDEDISPNLMNKNESLSPNKEVCDLFKIPQLNNSF
jgi:hypothetical protein